MLALLAQLVEHPAHQSDTSAIRASAAMLQGEWDAFSRMAYRHRVTRRAVLALQAADVAVPDALVRQAGSGALGAMAQIAQAHRVQSLLEQHSIPSLVLKGAVLSHSLYGDASLRESTDVDMLVERDDFARAVRLLVAQMGYTTAVNVPLDSDRLSLWLDGNKDVLLVSPEGAQLELHHRLTAARELLPDVGMKQATRRVTIGPKVFAQFDPASLFTYLSVHGAASRWHRLTWLADMRAMIAGASEADLLDWHHVAVRLGVERCTLSAMLLCERLWGGALPSPIRAAAGADADVAKIVANSLETLSDPDYLPATARGSGYIRNAWLLRDGWAYRVSLMKEIALDPDMVGDVAVPYRWRYLYIPLRAAQWIKRKFAKLTGR